MNCLIKSLIGIANRDSRATQQKLFDSLVLLACCGLALVSCQLEPREKLKEQYERGLTEHELRRVFADEQLTPIAIGRGTDQTLIVFDSPKGAGAVPYWARVGVYEQYALGRYPSPDRSITYITKFGPCCDNSKVFITNASPSSDKVKPSYIAVVIRDKTISKQVDSVKIIFNDASEKIVPTNGKRGILYNYDRKVTPCCHRIILSSASGKEVYSESLR
jgi:hypothetical protein